jgi:hypothetical protein
MDEICDEGLSICTARPTPCRTTLQSLASCPLSCTTGCLTAVGDGLPRNSTRRTGCRSTELGSGEGWSLTTYYTGIDLIIGQIEVRELRDQQAHDEMLMDAPDPGGELHQRELEDSRLSEKMVTTNVIKVYVE